MQTEQHITVASSKDLPTFMIERNSVFITVYDIPLIILNNIQNVVDSPHDPFGFLVLIRS